MITRFRLVLILVGILSPVAVAASQQTSPQSTGSDTAAKIPGAVATVNGEPIYVEDLERKLAALHSGTAEQTREAPDFDLLMFGLVNDQLIAQEARNIGLDKEEPLASQVDDFRTNLAKQSLERHEVRGKAEPKEAEVMEAFHDQYQRISFRIITVRTQDEASEVRGRLENGEEFAPLVREYSIDQYKTHDGLVESLERRNVPSELANQAYAAEPGELLGPIPTSIGWAILEIQQIREADPERFAEVEPQVRSVVQQRHGEEIERELAVRLKDRHQVTINSLAVDSVTLEKVADGRILPRVEDASATVAVVGNRAITAGEYKAALGRGVSGIGNETVAASIKPLVLDSLVHDELMKVEALNRGFDKLDEVEKSVRAYESELLVIRYLDDVLGPSVDVSAEEAEQYYEDHKSEFQRPPRVRVGRITVDNLAEAQRVAALLEQGTDPAWLAREHSIDDRRDDGGDLGWLTPGKLGFPDLDRSLYEAQPGTVLGPKPVGPNFAIFFTSAREEQGIFPYEQITGNVKQTAASAKLMQTIHETLQTLRNQSEIIMYDDALDNLSITASPQEKEHSDLSSPGH